MGKSENGPGMLDCAMYLEEIQKNTDSRISVLLEADGAFVGSRICYAVVATSKTLTVDGPSWSCSVTGRWPCTKHKSFEACLFWALGGIDAEIARQHFQQQLDIA